MWPQRLIDIAGEAYTERFTFYWVIGLPTIPSSELAMCKQFLREWQNGVVRDTSDQNLPSKNTVQTRFLPRKLFLQQALVPSVDESPPKEVRRSRDAFEKFPGSNPGQIRQQLLQHATGSDATQGSSHQPAVKLRPAKWCSRN
jgi:hypothetical protein